MVTPDALGTDARETHHDPRHSSLRSVVARHHQLGRLPALRVQLLHATDETRLAHVRDLLRIHHRAVRRDVRVPAHNLLTIRVAYASVSRHRSPWPRLRVSAQRCDEPRSRLV